MTLHARSPRKKCSGLKPRKSSVCNSSSSVGTVDAADADTDADDNDDDNVWKSSRQASGMTAGWNMPHIPRSTVHNTFFVLQRN
mmetsp:Transcript_24092/g.27866  ORF Transcript_24092/g.27866 Transcript_24092/m.27866 type:complete len:84 (+) Transcript_24092:312-563(+)